MWLRAFLLTQLVEMPIYAWALGRPAMPRRALWLRALAAFGASAITHPLVWMSTGHLASALGFWPAVAIIELGVVGVEAVYFRLWRLRRALFWAFAANAASFGIGLIVGELGWLG
jgi:hypothetical protein